MARQLSWKDLRIGLAGLAAVTGIVLAVLLLAEVGGIRGPKVTVYVTAASARSVLKGTEVMLSGKRVGTVKQITFRDPTTDTLSRLLMEVELLRSALPLLRRDSYAEIRPSGTIIGAPVVDIAVGTTTSPALVPGDTVPARPQVVTERFMERANRLTDEVSGAFVEGRSILANIRTVSGTFGAMRVRGPQDMAEFQARTASLMRQLGERRGTIGHVLHDDELQLRARHAVASADTIAALLSSTEGSIGRFRRDETLLAAMESTRTELAAVSAALTEARGTAGRLRQDEALSNALAELRQQLDTLIEDFKENPFRYLTF